MRHIGFVALTVWLFLLLPTVDADTVLTEDTVWSDTALVEGMLEVPAGLTLTIEAGYPAWNQMY